MIRRFPFIDERRSARSCVRKMSGFDRQNRMARQPRSGLASVSREKPGMTLSPPRSSVRMVTLRPRIAFRTLLYAWYWSSSDGKWLGWRKRNSERKSPIPSPPCVRTESTSSGSSMLASMETSLPSTVSAGSCLSSFRMTYLRCHSFLRSSYSSRVSSSGSTMTVPRVPSTISSSPAFTWRVMSESPSTAGISLDLARMAVWEVFPPTSAAMPEHEPCPAPACRKASGCA